MLELLPAPEFKKLVTFIPNKHEPIHNWYYFKEGFSKQLVDHFLKKFEIGQHHLVLDPFSGVGTTILTCKQNGIRSVGIEVSPFFAFVSKVKNENYDFENLEGPVREALRWKFEKPRESLKDEFLKRAFSKYALEDLIFYKNKIFEVEDQKIRNFLLLGLIDSAIKSSYTVKDGAVLKIFKRGVPPLGKMFKYKIKRMLRDVRKSNLPKTEAKIEIGDARILNAESNTVDAVITSPPYLNKIEYTKIYRLELSLFFDYPETQLRSYISERTDEYSHKFREYPPIAQAYFKDMELVFKELFRVCKKGAKLAIVIGGAHHSSIFSRSRKKRRRAKKS